MRNLELFLDNYKNNEINTKIYDEYKSFDYDDKEIFIMDLNFLLENIYNIKVINREEKIKRLGQQDFKKILLEKYNNKCIITENDCLEELEACHIIPVSENENYEIDNGLLLERNIHITFDKYYWSINPETLKIEILNDINVGSIKKYNNNKVNLLLTNQLKNNLMKHYLNFKNINY